MTEYKNYICIDGKKAELTEEQLKALGIELKKSSPFKRVGKCLDPEAYFYIHQDGRVFNGYDDTGTSHNELFNVANYCTDKAMMEHRALHETLSRLLWRYSMEHDGDKINWSDETQAKFFISYDSKHTKFTVYHAYFLYRFEVAHFIDEETARAAIEEIIKPFMEAHPDFKW